MKVKSERLNPRFYNGSRLTSHNIKDLLVGVLANIGNIYEDCGCLIMDAWPDIIGSQLAAMTQAVCFREGILYVKVRNSTLYSLLVQNDKSIILDKLRKKFPKVAIKTIVFRVG